MQADRLLTIKKIADYLYCQKNSKPLPFPFPQIAPHPLGQHVQEMVYSLKIYLQVYQNLQWATYSKFLYT